MNTDSVERAFALGTHIQRFIDTSPAQVRNVRSYTQRYDGIGSLLEEVRKHSKTHQSKAKKEHKVIGKKDDSRGKEILRRQHRNEQIIEYEKQKNQLIYNKSLGDAYNTIFISRIPITVTEDELINLFKPHCEKILNIRIIKRFVKNGKVQRLNYAFLELSNRNDVKKIVNTANTIGGSKLFTIHGKTLQVDPERGRIVKNWLPLRLRR